MRAAKAAALTNFLLILLIAAGFMLASGPDSTHVYSNPTKAAFQNAAIVLIVLAVVVAPLAAVASWRTWVHARGYQTGNTTGWQGLLEAVALGFALTLPLVLPFVVARQFNPGPWGQPQAFLLGLGYVGAYGLLGAAVGLVLGLLLWLSASIVLRIHRHTRS